MIRDKKIKFGPKLFDNNSDPYIIAEIGVNHEGSMEKAKKLIDLAKEGGADAAKFQSYKADTLASKNSPAYWDTSKEKTRSQHELFKKYDSFEPKDYVSLADYCQQKKIDFLSTPFDDKSVDYLRPIVPFFKISSSDITNIPFLRKIACTGKPVILSTGASKINEIDRAILSLRNAGCQDIALLHCILNYPTKSLNANLSMISSLKKTYPNHIIGYSDHTLPGKDMLPLQVAYMLGAVIIEKHFTDDKSMPGNDHYHAMDISDLKLFRNTIDKIKILVGKETVKKPIPTEKISRENARRSIVTSCKIKKGEKFSEKNLTYKRPASGISPKYWDEVINLLAERDMEPDHILKWNDTNKK